jgi:hypothetical protein
MLSGKHKLMREGAQGQAVVLREQRRGAGTRDWRQYLDARFQCPDGSLVELSGHVLQSDVGSAFFTVGDLVPVRYDPADHRRIVFDVHQLKADRAARDAGREQIAPAISERTGQMKAATPKSALAPDQVAAALEMMANLGELRHSGGLTDSEYVAEKVKFLDLMNRRTSGAITDGDFQAENAIRLAGLLSSANT